MVRGESSVVRERRAQDLQPDHSGSGGLRADSREQAVRLSNSALLGACQPCFGEMEWCGGKKGSRGREVTPERFHSGHCGTHRRSQEAALPDLQSGLQGSGK